MPHKELLGCQVFRDTEVRAGWRLEPLRQHIELAYGFALQDERRNSGPVRVFGSNGQVGWHDEIGVPGPGILVGRKGTVGAVHFTAGDFWPIDTVYYVKLLKDHNLRFVYHLLSFLPLDILNAATGVPGLSRRDAYALLAPFPSPEEQAAIARILDAVDTAIERIQDAIDRARDLKTALVQELLTNGTRGEATRKTAIGYIPGSWAIVALRDVVSVFQYGLSVAMDRDGKLPILRMGNIQNGEVTFNELKYVKLSESITEPYLCKRGDVFFNRTNSQEHVGKVGIYCNDRPAVFASYLIRLHTKNEIMNNYYLGQLLNSQGVQGRIKRFATPGVQQVNINAKNLGRVLIPMPQGPEGLEEQRRIAAILEQADEGIWAFGPVISALHDLKRSLMHDLLTGKVRTERLKLDEVAA